MMSKCCNTCFNDNELRRKIRTLTTNDDIECEFCTGQSEVTISCDSLKLDFEFLIDTLFIKEDGDNSDDLAVLLQNKLLVFSEEVVSHSQLLKCIVNDDRIYDGSTKYSPITFDTEYTGYWTELREELVTKNRFFPQNPLFTSLFRDQSTENRVFLELVGQLTDSIPKGSDFCRARISDNILPNEGMGKPPQKLATDGRANPIGIAYLYTSKEISTSVSEVRPSIGDTICVAILNSSAKLKVIDLTTPRKKFNPTTFEDKELIIALSLIEMLEQLSKELSIPIAQERTLNYLPTQFFCEFIKSLKLVDGVKFCSSFDGQNNFVFFEPQKQNFFNIAHKKLIRINSTQHTIEDI
jgi:hypothetical protein